MKLLNSLKILTILCLFISCGATKKDYDANNHSNSSNKNAEDEKCYARSILPDEFKSVSEIYAVYNGDASKENVDLEEVIIIHPESTKWVKKLSDQTCLSDDPNDCMVWSRSVIPSVKDRFFIVKDTTESKNFVLQNIERKELIFKSDYAKVEILCDDEMTVSMVKQIQDALTERKYYSGNNTSKINTKTLKALTKYQIENNLPVGQLNIETLDSLGIIRSPRNR